MTTTKTEIVNYTYTALAEHVGDFDLDAIAAELIETYPVIGDFPEMTLDDVPSDEFWAIVAKHDMTAQS